MKRENRYIVIKRVEALCALSEMQFLALEHIGEVVEEYRRSKQKPPFECVVVERDWPEYEPTWKAIEERVDREQGPRSSTLNPMIRDRLAGELSALEQILFSLHRDSGDHAEQCALGVTWISIKEAKQALAKIGSINPETPTVQ